MTAIGEAFELRRVLDLVFEAETWITEDIGRTFPIRLFRQGRRIGAEPVLEAVYSGMNKALRTQSELGETMLAFDRAFEHAMRPQAKHDVAMKMLAKQEARWRGIKAAMFKNDRESIEDLAAWLDRDIAERMAIARKLGGSKPTLVSAAKKKAPPPTAIAKGLTKAEKAADAAVAKHRIATKETHDAFLDAAAESRATEFDSFNRLAAYFKYDDPMWERIADKVMSHRAGKDTGNVAHAIQGVIGEALALRNAWVVDSIIKATERANRIATKLGKSEWEVVLTQAPVFATTKTGGVGELYDASLWIVRKSEAGDLEAAPVLYQVKSGGSEEAAEQIGRDFSREPVGEVRLPVLNRAVKSGESGIKSYKIKNLRELLRSKGLEEAKGEVGGLTTQRVLVSPRAPSTGKLIKHLPKGTSIDYVGGLMTKREIQGISEAIRNGLK